MAMTTRRPPPNTLLDSAALLATGRADGAAYLSGYVVECALKSLLAICRRLGRQDPRPGGVFGSRSLNWPYMRTAKSAAAAGRLNGCCSARRSSIGRRRFAIARRRCRLETAETWQREAAEVYGQVVGALVLEGRL